MANSLGDQFLKMGLVDKKKLKSAKKEKHHQAVQQSKKGVLSEAQKQVQLEKQQKQQRDKELNQQKQAQAQAKAIAAQIKQLIQMNCQPRDGGDVKYHFTHTMSDGKQLVKSLLVTAQMSKQLADGYLSVAFDGDNYQVIPSVVAQKIAQRDASALIVFNESSESTEEQDDPYADFQVPDDLMW